MRKLLLFILLLPLIGIAQEHFYFTFFAGAANYQGDLRNKRFAVDQSRGALGIGLKYDFGPHVALRSSISFAKIEGDDKKNIPELRYRNLNFQSKIIEWNVMVEYSFSDLSKKGYSPYIFAGLGLFHFSPFTYDTLGNKFDLQPLGTEGQGLAQYPDRKMYKLTELNIPFGIGIKFLVHENFVLGYEIGWRKLFTDYLDDVSKTYVDKDVLAQGRGEKAVELAYRGGELKGGSTNYPGNGSMRGKGELGDWYYFHGITLAVDMNIFQRSDVVHRPSGKRGSVACPRVW